MHERPTIGGPGWDKLTELEAIAYGWQLQGRNMRVGARAFEQGYTVFTDAAYRAERKIQNHFRQAA
jgi:hypothetical protein